MFPFFFCFNRFLPKVFSHFKIYPINKKPSSKKESFPSLFGKEKEKTIAYDFFPIEDSPRMMLFGKEKAKTIASAIATAILIVSIPLDTARSLYPIIKF